VKFSVPKTKKLFGEVLVPRKKWVPKNPYCKNSRLDKRSFERLVDCYIHEAFSFSREYSYLLFNALVHTEDKAEARRFFEHKFKSSSSSDSIFKSNVITKHSFNKYFEKIGNHLWRAFVNSKSELFQKRETAFDELLELIYEKIDKISNSPELFEFLGKSALNINRDNIARSLMFYLLSQRSQVMRGFIRERFYLEFIRIYFICRVVETDSFGLKSIYSLVWPPPLITENYPDDVEIVRIQSAARVVLLDFLEECPM
jgi:arsenate reductase-like glutaredoxin family protein